MCNFFSCDSAGDGKPLYFDWELRKKVLSGELKRYEPDSHTSNADYFGYKAEKEDVLNKYEYNPLTKIFVVDQLNVEDDSAEIQKWLSRVDWKTIVEPLIIKPIIHPFKDRNCTEVTPADVVLLKKWASVGDSVWDSVRASVWASVGASVRDSVWDSVWASVRDSVRVSVWDSVGASVRVSVWASVWVYVSSFFNLEYKYDLSSCITLWEKGLVPTFNGILWRLHGSPDGKILWEGKI